MNQPSAKKLKILLKNQLKEWSMAACNFQGLKEVQTKSLNLGSPKIKIQFNPKRKASSDAKVDKKTIAERPCFLCRKNRPKEQKRIVFETYEILINPFPVFPEHFTIPYTDHIPQLIQGRIGDFLELTSRLSPYVLFYNGPFCGASAPDHLHFQAGNSGFLPIEKAARNKAQQEIIFEKESNQLFRIKDFPCQTLVIKSSDKQFCKECFDKILNLLPIREGHNEPMLNLLCFYQKGKWFLLIIPRKKHRPSCFFNEGDKKITISPASVDLGGVFITPVKRDFEKTDEELILEIYDEVCFNKKEINSLINRIKSNS